MPKAPPKAVEAVASNIVQDNYSKVLEKGRKMKVNKYIQIWLRRAPSFKSLGLYIRLGQFHLPLSSVVEFKVRKSRPSLTYKDSQDRSKILKIWAKVGHQHGNLPGRRFFRTKDIIGRQGLGTQPFQQWSRSTSREKRSMIQDEV